MKNYILIFSIFAVACVAKKNDNIPLNQAVPNVDSLRDSIDFNWKLDIRVTTFIDSLLRTNQKVLALYETRCWIPDCSPKGFVLCINNSENHLYFFRLKRLYQDIYSKDSIIFVGNIFQYLEVKPKISLMNSLASSINGFINKKIPCPGDGGSLSHDNICHIWFKNLDKEGKTALYSSRLLCNTKGYENIALSFYQIMSMMYSKFEGTNFNVVNDKLGKSFYKKSSSRIPGW